METKANYAIVGLFTVIVIFMAFGFVYWMSQYQRGGDMVQLLLKIPGSANGLSVGSAVRFNGIPVGSVRELNFDAKDPRYSMALTEIRSDAPVYPDTRAVLEIQGLTGTAYIELSGGDTSKTPILQIARQTGKPATLTAEQSGVTNLLATASKILARSDTLIGDLQSFVKANKEPLTKIVANVEVFSKALKDNSKGVDTFLKSVSELSATFDRLSVRLDSTLASVDKVVKAVDPEQISTIVTNVEKISRDLASASGDVPATVKSIREAAEIIDKIGKRVDPIVAAIDPKKVAQSMDDIKTAVSEARIAFQSFRKVADTLNSRIGPIARSAEALMQDARRAVQSLDTAISRFDRNPQSLLFGGEEIKQYNGRMRR